MDKPRVAVTTTFYEWSTAYSLTSVVESQLVSLVKYGYKPILFVHDNFKDDDKVPTGVEIRKVVPRFTLVDYSGMQPVTEDFEDQVETVYKALVDNTKDVDIIFEHDLIFQGWFLPYCVAIHKFARENNKIKWFHWIHSVPNANTDAKYPHSFRFILPENSKLVYLNNFHLIRAAEAYKLWPRDVRVVYNPVDPRLYWNLDPLVKNTIDRYDLFNCDFMQTYAVSTPRMMSGKQLDVVIEIFAQLKKLGRSVRLVVCNAHANDKREKQIIAEALSFASSKGLSRNEIVFTSLEDEPQNELGVSRQIVSQFMNLSNLFIFPSQSENCPLILLEAMMAKNMLILNSNVGSMRELAQDNAYYFNFGSIEDNVNYTNRDKFMEDVAKIIISEYEQSKVLKGSNKLKKDFNFDTIFKRQIEPLFTEQ